MHYKGDVSELELYFVVLNNEYGEQTEDELIPGGKDMHVTKDNVIAFIHLVANYRLNYQINVFSSYLESGNPIDEQSVEDAFELLHEVIDVYDCFVITTSNNFENRHFSHVH
ncbi:hypothetical protein Cni_G02422 [Canna indica]|uniref:HECT-type E3 ubiquitin transferase n=1 Tax=Canna indica TaxID=4628 RepID=A0AAQ3JR43_9LILI|nr:hypothetical protein Cni_G02422 [Canna indica]